VLPVGGAGMDTILGHVMQTGDLIDLRPALAATTWNGSTASLGSYLGTRLAGNDAIVSVKPGGAAGGASYDIARFGGSGAVSLAMLTQHAIL
jgi:hypothetical protein